MTAVTARACANIALVKYWGKRDAALNLPAAGSLSLTLDALVTETTVVFDPRAAADSLVLDGAIAALGDLARTTAILDLVRTRAKLDILESVDLPGRRGKRNLRLREARRRRRVHHDL